MPGADGLVMRQDEATVVIPFICQAEIYTVAEFQAAGHYVASTIRGERVFILTLHQQGHQILRTQGSTYSEALAAMHAAIPATLYSLWAQSQIQTSVGEQFKTLHDERNKLAEFIAAHYTWELEHGLAGSTFDIAIFYLRRERTRLWARLQRLFRRQPQPRPLERVGSGNNPAAGD